MAGFGQAACLLWVNAPEHRGVPLSDHPAHLFTLRGGVAGERGIMSARICWILRRGARRGRLGRDGAGGAGSGTDRLGRCQQAAHPGRRARRLFAAASVTPIPNARVDLRTDARELRAPLRTDPMRHRLVGVWHRLTQPGRPTKTKVDGEQVVGTHLGPNPRPTRGEERFHLELTMNNKNRAINRLAPPRHWRSENDH
jgi:hypothetical protein